MKRWLLTLIWSIHTLHLHGEHAWPGAIRFIWPLCQRDVDEAMAARRAANQAERNQT